MIRHSTDRGVERVVVLRWAHHTQITFVLCRLPVVRICPSNQALVSVTILVTDPITLWRPLRVCAVVGGDGKGVRKLPWIPTVHIHDPDLAVVRALLESRIRDSVVSL